MNWAAETTLKNSTGCVVEKKRNHYMIDGRGQCENFDTNKDANDIGAKNWSLIEI